MRVQYTNQGKPEGNWSPPKTTTRPIHKVAVVVPAEYMFKDDTCDNVVRQRCPKRDLELRGEMEAAKAPRKDSAKAKEGELERGGVQPAARRRRGRPRKAEKPPATGKRLQTSGQGTAGAAAETGVFQEAGNQIPTTRRGRPRDLGPRKQRDGGRSC